MIKSVSLASLARQLVESGLFSQSGSHSSKCTPILTIKGATWKSDRIPVICVLTKHGVIAPHCCFLVDFALAILID